MKHDWIYDQWVKELLVKTNTSGSLPPKEMNELASKKSSDIFKQK